MDKPLVICYIAMENGRYTDDFPIENGGSGHSYVSGPEGYRFGSDTVLNCILARLFKGTSQLHRGI